ncbi:hypothetical protein Hypma_013705 [Hypsizygus marmoreus]|uniref:Uncharacterized protein n=1 Tax=Hypsizygus marmoreus TaxID=39966 RepID=A0A369JHR0_HYPMA|nr:hypothetical protein Hypma_013705 [Hypsizygus marmoreus]
MLNVGEADIGFQIPEVSAPLQPPVLECELLSKLDDYTQPGLYDEEFRALLAEMVRCSCGMVMLKRVHRQHRCSKALLRPIKRQRLDID